MGLDFGFTSVLKGKCRLIVQRTTLLVSIISIVLMSVYLAFLYHDIWCWINTIKNNGLILILITTKYKLYHLIYDIHGICDLTTKQIETLNIMTILYTIAMYTLKIIALTIRCIWEIEPYCGQFYSMFYYNVYFGIELTLHIIVVAQFIITYYLKCSLNLIKVLLKKPNRKLEVYEKSYTAIADCYDKIRPLYDWMVSCC